MFLISVKQTASLLWNSFSSWHVWNFAFNCWKVNRGYIISHTFKVPFAIQNIRSHTQNHISIYICGLPFTLHSTTVRTNTFLSCSYCRWYFKDGTPGGAPPLFRSSSDEDEDLVLRGGEVTGCEMSDIEEWE